MVVVVVVLMSAVLLLLSWRAEDEGRDCSVRRYALQGAAVENALWTSRQERIEDEGKYAK